MIENNSKQAKEIYSFLVKVLGAKFQEHRVHEELSLRDIYKSENISMAVVSDLENGLKSPRVETLIQLLLAVGYPLKEVFNDKILPPTVKGQRMRTFESCSPYQDIKELMLVHGFNVKQIEKIIDYMEYVKQQTI